MRTVSKRMCSPNSRVCFRCFHSYPAANSNPSPSSSGWIDFFPGRTREIVFLVPNDVQDFPARDKGVGALHRDRGVDQRIHAFESSLPGSYSELQVIAPRSILAPARRCEEPTTSRRVHRTSPSVCSETPKMDCPCRYSNGGAHRQDSSTQIQKALQPLYALARFPGVKFALATFSQCLQYSRVQWIASTRKGHCMVDVL